MVLLPQWPFWDSYLPTSEMSVAPTSLSVCLPLPFPCSSPSSHQQSHSQSHNFYTCPPSPLEPRNILSTAVNMSRQHSQPSALLTDLTCFLPSPETFHICKWIWASLPFTTHQCPLCNDSQALLSLPCFATSYTSLPSPQESVSWTRPVPTNPLQLCHQKDADRWFCSRSPDTHT